MDNTKFTKGKWEINKRASRNVRCNNLTIANCSSGQDGENEIEEKANALLISKSPELLEALYNLLKWSAHFPPAMNDDLEVANKLIKEATEI